MKNGVENIQAMAYNGPCTVSFLELSLSSNKLNNPDDIKPQKEEQDKTTFIWKEPKLAANLGGLGSYHHLSTTPKAMNFSLNSDV